MDKHESDFMLSFAEKTDGVNKRITRALIAMAIVLAVVVVAFCVRDSIVANNYFEHGSMSGISVASISRS